MTHTPFIRGLLLGILFVPATVLAYTSPEEVLTSDQNYQYFDPPPNSRSTREIQAMQQSSNAARRQAEQDALFGKSSSSAPAAANETAHDAAPSDQNALLQQLVDQLSQNQNNVSVSDQRALDRIHQQQYDSQVQAQAMIIAAQLGLNQGSLHSGAPLSETGPGTTVALIVLSLAGLWTFRHARRMEKKL